MGHALWRFRQILVPDAAPTGEHDEVAEVLDADNLLVVQIWNPKDRDIKNLRFIAAAPEMLYACQCVLAGEPHARKAAQDTVAKAKGGIATVTMTESEMIDEARQDCR